MSETLVTIIIVTYNSADTIRGALDSVEPAHRAGLVRCVVVDNVSRDSAVAIVRRDYDWVTVIESGANIGYGRGCNLGLEVADTRYVMFMNPDARLDHEAVTTMAEFFETHERCAMVAPAIVEGEHIQGCGVLPTPWRIIRRAAGSRSPRLRLTPIMPGSDPFETDWLCGAILMIRTELAKELGGFDPAIFLYFDETDLCRRLTDEGWELWAVGRAVAYHDANTSAEGTGEDLVGGCIAEHYFRSRYYYLRKHHGRAAAVMTELVELALLALRTPLRWVRGRVGYFGERLRLPIMSMPIFPSTKHE